MAINREYSDDRFATEGDLLKVKLREVGTFKSNAPRRSVVFKVTPDISETRAVNYKTIDPIHGPGTIYSYMNTSSRNYNLSSIKLVSRSREEATRNLARLNLIRSWCMPTFGQYTAADGSVRSPDEQSFGNNNFDVLGSPPKVLEFSAYADEQRTGNIYRIPTVITQLSVNYPSDIEYIPTVAMQSIPSVKANTPFPTILTIDINLSETHSPVEYSNFSIADYRNANLTGF
jgi:hypothetical protein